MGIELNWIISFLILMVMALVIIIAILKWSLVSSTQGAVNHLNQEIASANTAQAELAKKIRDANEELAQKRADVRELSEKLHQMAEDDVKDEKDRIISDARSEADEVIEKAKNAKDRMRSEIQTEEEQRIVDHSIRIITHILGEKALGGFNDVLVEDYLAKLQSVDMSKISSDIKAAEIVTVKPINDAVKEKFNQVLRGKLNRNISLQNEVDPNIGGGVVLKFGSIALDGSIKSLVREAGNKIKEEVNVQA